MSVGRFSDGTSAMKITGVCWGHLDACFRWNGGKKICDNSSFSMKSGRDWAKTKPSDHGTTYTQNSTY
jgi:hypothetical protein